MHDPASQPAFGANIAKNITARELNQARNILGVIGVLTIAVQAVSLSDLHHQVARHRDAGPLCDTAVVVRLQSVQYVSLTVGVAYLICAFLVSRKPVIATVTGLVLFVGTIVAQAVVEITMMFSIFGLGLRIAILIALVSAVR